MKLGKNEESAKAELLAASESVGVPLSAWVRTVLLRAARREPK